MINSSTNNAITSGFKLPIIILYLVEFILLGLLLFEEYKLALGGVVFVFGLIALYDFFENPFHLLPVFLLSILAGSIESGSSEIVFASLLFPVVIIIFLIKSFFEEPENFFEKYKILIFFSALFLVWSMFSTMMAPNKPLAIAYWRNYLGGYTILFFGLFFIKNALQIRFMLLTFVLWGVILAAIIFSIILTIGDFSTAVVQLFLYKNLLATSWGRSNYLAAFYVLLIPITLGYLLTVNSKRLKILFSFAILLMFGALTFTLSKGGVLTLSIALLIFISRVVNPKIFFSVLLVLVVGIAIILLNPLTFLIIEGLINVDSNLSTFSRINFYEDVWKTFLKNPVTGVGLANLGHFAKFKVTTDMAASAHNIILGTLGETGIVGSFLFMGTLIWSFIQIVKNYLNEKNEKFKILLWSFVCSFIGVFLHSMMEPNLEGFQFAVMFWSFVAVSFKFSELSDAEKADVLRFR